jgi:hypothetical protein
MRARTTRHEPRELLHSRRTPLCLQRPVPRLTAANLTGGHGSYSTKGNYAAGAVLGTRWLTEDLCEGTLIHVVTDRVAVTSFVNHRHLTVTAGHSYLAKGVVRICGWHNARPAALTYCACDECNPAIRR